jgi:hypothetical protein
MASKRITFVVDTENDQDIIRWLDAQSNYSAAIRAAIRQHARRLTVDDVRRVVRGVVREELSTVKLTALSDEAGDESGEDEEMGSLLDSMF